MDRDTIINHARSKYILTGHTRNITEALRLYLEHDAGVDEQIALSITTPEPYQMQRILDKNRPTCDYCSTAMRMKLNAVDIEGNKYPTSWLCPGCGIEEYSQNNFDDWKEILSREDLGDPGGPKE